MLIVPAPEIPKKILAVERESLSMSCKVPYSSSYCYMKRPGWNGTIYPVEDNLNLTVGLCTFTKEGVSMADNGTWYCGFARKTGEIDSLYEFQVNYLYQSNVYVIFLKKLTKLLIQTYKMF